MSAYSQFSTNEKFEKEGVTIDYGDFRVLIARAGGSNKKFASTLETESKPYRRAIQTKTLDEKTSQKIIVRTYAKAVILGWDNMKGKDGQVLDYNFDNVVQVMTDLPDLFKTIQEEAQDLSNFQDKVNEDDAGNL